MGLFFLTITGCLLFESGSISIVRDTSTAQPDSGETSTDTGNANPDFSERWEQAQWLNLENDTVFWARLSAIQLLKSTSLPIQTVLNPLSDCDDADDFNPNSLDFDGNN